MADRLLRDVARLMAEVAAAETMPRWRNLGAGEIAEKTGPDDLVTIADQATETALARRLAALLPGAGVVGEEAVAADPRLIERLRGRGPVWVIDPIDGTAAFAAGEPEFTLMVALVEDGRATAGWILAPALGWVACGGPGRGAHLAAPGGELAPLPRPATPGSLAAMIGLLGKRNVTAARRAELQAKEAHFRKLDGVTFAGLDYVRLLKGEAHFAVYNKTEPWDHLPGLAILAAHEAYAARHDGTAYRPGDNTGGLLIAPDAASYAAIKAVLLD